MSATEAMGTAAAFNERVPSFDTSRSDDRRSLASFIELRGIDATATILGSVLDVQASAARAPGGASARDGPALDAARHLLRGLQLLEACTACTAQAGRGADGAAGGPCDRLRGPLLEQLADGAVVGVVSRIPPFVQQQLWRRASAAGCGAAGSAAQRPPAAGSPQLPATVTADERAYGGMLLAAAARYADDVLRALHAPSGGAEAARVGPAFLEALSAEGLLASLSTALLAAPPWRGAEPYDHTLDAYTNSMLLAQHRVVTAVRTADLCAVTFCPTAASAALVAPGVLNLQWELLEQVAAVMKWDGPSQEGAGEGSGANRGTAAGGGSAGRGGACGSTHQPQRRRWPLLDPRCLRLASWGSSDGPSQLPASLNSCLATALTVPYCLSAMPGSAAEPPVVALGSRMRAAVAAAERLLPSRAAAAALAARVAAALCARAQQLGPGVACEPRGLLDSAECLERLVLFRMRGAARDELEACLPDVLAMLGWLVALQATPAGLQAASLQRVVATVSSLASCLHGSAFDAGVLLPIRVVKVSEPDAELRLWPALEVRTRLTCLRRLQALDLPRSLDRLVRWATERGEPLGGDHGVRWLLHAGLPVVLGPLLRARLLRWRLRQEMQPPPQPRQQGDAAVSGALGGRGSSSTSEAGGGWRAREELGLALTALKLLRRGLASPGEAGCVPELLAEAAPRLSLSLFVMRLACDAHGLSGLLPELLACTRRTGSGGGEGGTAAGGSLAGAGGASTAAGAGAAPAEASSGPGAVDLCMVAQAVVACGAAALLMLTRLLEEAADGAQSSFGSSGSFPLPHAIMRTMSTAAAVLMAIKSLPADVLLVLAPQRALVALARLQLLLTQRLQRQPNGELSIGVGCVTGWMISAIKLLSTDERLVAACVPGWVWVKGSPAPAQSVDPAHAVTEHDWTALSQLAGPSYVPQQGPVVTAVSGVPEAAGFGSWRWRDHGQHRAEVAAFAREWAGPPGLMNGRAGGGLALWPPRLLRLCGNESCSNYAGGCEAELTLQKCSGCRGVRYCGERCQKLHWRAQHKRECGRWAAASEA